RDGRTGRGRDGGSAARGAALSVRLGGFPHQRRAHRGGRFYPIVAERRGVPCPGLRDAADRYACCDVLLRDRPANCSAIARKAHGPACPRGADLVRLRRRRSHHAARSGADTWLWVACWAIALALLLRSDNSVPAVLAPRPIPAPLRVAHGVSALALLLIFLALHNPHPFMFPAAAGTSAAVMKVFRHVYRAEILQPLVVTLFLFQIGTGLFFAWRLTAAPTDRFRTFQIASGVYLAFYVLGHMDSVFIFARTY